MEKVIKLKHPDKALLCSLYLSIVGTRFRLSESSMRVAGMLMDKYGQCVEAGIDNKDLLRVLVLGKDHRKEVRDKLLISPQVFTNCIKLLKEHDIVSDDPNKDVINKEYMYCDTLTFKFSH